MSQQPPDAIRYFAAMGLAGAAYPWLVAMSVAIWIAQRSVGGIPWEGLWPTLFVLVCCSGVGALASVFGSLLAIMLATALLALLGLPTGGVRFHSFAAGLLGFIPGLAVVTMLGIMAGPSKFGSNIDWSGLFLFILLGPGIATPLYQFAGAMSTWPAEERLPPMPTWRFGIRQLLIATLWTALALTAAKLAGEVSLSLWAGGWLLVWLVYQSFTMWLVLRILDWRLGRRSALEGSGRDGMGMGG